MPRVSASMPAELLCFRRSGCIREADVMADRLSLWCAAERMQEKKLRPTAHMRVHAPLRAFTLSVEKNMSNFTTQSFVNVCSYVNGSGLSIKRSMNSQKNSEQILSFFLK